jgi:hypothetical protein
VEEAADDRGWRQRRTVDGEEVCRAARVRLLIELTSCALVPPSTLSVVDPAAQQGLPPATPTGDAHRHCGSLQTGKSWICKVGARGRSRRPRGGGSGRPRVGVEAEADDRGWRRRRVTAGAGGATAGGGDGGRHEDGAVSLREGGREENIPGMQSWGVLLRAFCSYRCSSSNIMLKDGEATGVGLNSEG